MEEVISNSVNGVHPSVDAHKKRKSHPSPMLDVAETPSVASPEVKRAKTAEFSENGVAHKNTEVTQVEFNDVLATILHVVQGLDKHKIMATVAISVVNGEKVEHSLQTIRTNLREAQYSSIIAFKDDISKICQQAISNNTREPEKQEHAQKLLQLASDLISDKLHYTIRSHGKKVRAREESQSSTPARDYEKVALFQRAPEGFVFTSKAVVKDDSLDQDLTKSVIVPTASTPTPPKLQEINSKLRSIQSMSERTKKKSTGVEYYPYGPFTSFAPFIDSSNAEMSAEDTAIAYEAFMARQSEKSKTVTTGSEKDSENKAQLESILQIAQQYKTHDNVADIKEADFQFLSDAGLDVKGLLQGMQSAEVNGVSLAPVEAIQRNAILLFELYKLQEERFASKDQSIGAREKQLAETLRNSLLELTNKVAPSNLVTIEAIENTMRKIPYKEPAFVGTLPPNKPFAYPINTTRSGLPPTATAYPTHIAVAPKKSLPPATIIPQVALSPHVNMTGGYPTIPQPNHHIYSSPQQPTHQKTYSRPRGNTPSAVPLQVSANGDITFRKNFHTLVTSTGGTPAHWRRNDSQIPCANCGTLVSPIWRLGARNEKLCNACGQYNKKWNGLQRPVSLFPNTVTPTFRK